jgi:hypothetical protein
MAIRKRLTTPKPKPQQITISPPDMRCWEGLKCMPVPGPGFVVCNTCRGYGKWWYVLNFLGVEGSKREQPCKDCEGVGFRKSGSCKHSWRFVKKVSEHESVERCTKCKKRRTIDSS